MQRESKIEKQLERVRSTQERIQAVLAGEQPTDVMSWEYYIWKTYKDPLARLIR